MPTPDVVLIVEDEEPIAEALAMIVEDAGYTAALAAHGREALEIARECHPALVITDLMMPYMSGGTLIEVLRAEAKAEGRAPPPIVVMTAAGGAKARESSGDAYLRKPFNLTDVDAVLKRFLRMRS